MTIAITLTTACTVIKQITVFSAFQSPDRDKFLHFSDGPQSFRGGLSPLPMIQTLTVLAAYLCNNIVWWSLMKKYKLTKATYAIGFWLSGILILLLTPMEIDYTLPVEFIINSLSTLCFIGMHSFYLCPGGVQGLCMLLGALVYKLVI